MITSSAGLNEYRERFGVAFSAKYIQFIEPLRGEEHDRT